MTDRIQAWFVDHSVGVGRKIFASGTTGTEINIVGVKGLGTTDLPPRLAPPGDTIPVGSDLSPVGGMTRADVFSTFRNVVGFGGSTVLTGIPTSTNNANWSMSLWVNFGQDQSFGFHPSQLQGAFFGNINDQSTHFLQFAPTTQDQNSLDPPGTQGTSITYDSNSYTDESSAFTFPGNGTTNAGWVHVMASAKLNVATNKIRRVVYVNDTELVNDSTATAVGTTFDFSHAYNAAAPVYHPNIGGVFRDGTDIQGGSYGVIPSGNGLYAGVTELWMKYGTFIDWSSSANRELFHVKSLALDNYAPCSLGPMGKLPTGTAPTLYLTGNPTQFPVNRSSTVTLTVTGSDLVSIDYPPE